MELYLVVELEADARVHLVDLDGEAVADALDGEVLPHRLHLLPQVDVLLRPALLAEALILLLDPLDGLAQHRQRAHRARVGRGGEPEVLLLDGLARADDGEVERDVAAALAALARQRRRVDGRVRAPPPARPKRRVEAAAAVAVLEAPGAARALGVLERVGAPHTLPALLTALLAGELPLHEARQRLRRRAPRRRSRAVVVVVLVVIILAAVAPAVAGGGGGAGRHPLVIHRWRRLVGPRRRPEALRRRRVLDAPPQVLLHVCAVGVRLALRERALDPRSQRRGPPVAAPAAPARAAAAAGAAVAAGLLRGRCRLLQQRRGCAQLELLLLLLLQEPLLQLLLLERLAGGPQLGRRLGGCLRNRVEHRRRRRRLSGGAADELARLLLRVRPERARASSAIVLRVAVVAADARAELGSARAAARRSRSWRWRQAGAGTARRAFLLLPRLCIVLRPCRLPLPLILSGLSGLGLLGLLLGIVLPPSFLAGTLLLLL